jgi:hypothetical protein
LEKGRQQDKPTSSKPTPQAEVIEEGEEMNANVNAVLERSG